MKAGSFTDGFWVNYRNSGEVNAWNGYAYEIVCIKHINQIKKALGINGVTTFISMWKHNAFEDENGAYWKGGQIDLIIDRDDRIINLCEIKYSVNEYLISKDYINNILERNNLFRLVTKTKKVIKTTFITIFGLMNSNNNYYVDNSITMEALFEK